MRRIIAILFASVALVGVLLDPYTWSLNASDGVVRGPAWQVTLGLIDAILLALAIGYLLRRQNVHASRVFTGELLYALATAVLLINRDGIARFVRGFGAEEFLSAYLMALAFRVAALGLVLGTTHHLDAGRRP
jgi:hypothetical protein